MAEQNAEGLAAIARANLLRIIELQKDRRALLQENKLLETRCAAMTDGSTSALCTSADVDASQLIFAHIGEQLAGRDELRAAHEAECARMRAAQSHLKQKLTQAEAAHAAELKRMESDHESELQALRETQSSDAGGPAVQVHAVRESATANEAQIVDLRAALSEREAALAAAVAAGMSSSDALERTRATYEGQVAELTARHNAAISECERLRNDLACAAEGLVQQAEAKSQDGALAELEARTLSSEERASLAETKAAESAAEASALRDELSATVQIAHDARAAVESHRAEMSQLEAQHTAERDEMLRANQELEDKVASSAADVSEVRAALAAVQNQLAEAQEALKAMEVARQDERSTFAEQLKEVSTLGRTCAWPHSRLATLTPGHTPAWPHSRLAVSVRRLVSARRLASATPALC